LYWLLELSRETYSAGLHGQTEPGWFRLLSRLCSVILTGRHVTGRKGELIPLEQVNEQHPHGGDWLREIVFGLNDGLVTTLVFIMAVSQIAPARLLLVVLGEVLAGGISMALGGYLSARTAKQILEQRIATERYEIEHEPEEERAELVSIYQNKGFTGPLLQHVVNHLTANKERWHRAMVHDELGVVEDTLINPWLEGVQVGLSFVLGGLIPTVPLLLSLPQASWWAYGLTALTALALGAIKARYTRQGPVRAGLEFLVVVTLGTLAGVGLGLLLHGG
jgi:vacuolar iron transporter family protein